MSAERETLAAPAPGAPPATVSGPPPPDGFPAPVEDFPDPGDKRLFPVLTEHQLEEVARFAERRRFERGDVLFEQRQREAPLHVIETGTVDLLDRRTGEADRYIARNCAGTFIGDIAMFTGEPTLAACLAAEESQVLEMDRAALRELVARFPDVGDVLLRTMMARRAWLEARDFGTLQLIGPERSPEVARLRSFLSRNQVPHRCLDPETDAASRALLDSLQTGRDALPVLVAATDVMHRPSVEEVADLLGLRPPLRSGAGDEPYDLVVVGAGPAGLAAAVYGASEGLGTLALDADSPGGQASTSSKIENYLGFATGISGGELARQAVLQARKFGAVLSNPLTARRLHCEDGVPGATVELADGQRVRGHAVVIATGAQYRKINAENLEAFEGAGVYYAATASEARLCEGEEVIVVGGGNSAGQAAVFLAQHARRVRLVLRSGPLTKSMSSYLAERIEESPDIEVLAGAEVAALHGGGGGSGEEGGALESATLTGTGVDGEKQPSSPHHRVAAAAVFVMIGAEPNSAWLSGCIGTDADGFVLAGRAAEEHAAFGEHWVLNGGAEGTATRSPFFLETTRPGVFTVGDVRSGSVKRVASAAGEGAMAVKFAHEVLALAREEVTA